MKTTAYIPKDKSDVDKAMTRKEQAIGKAHSVKSNSINIAGSARDATLIVTNFYPELAKSKDKEKEIAKKWTYWRKWLYNQSDVPFI